ncbi:MAG: hypothetical protein IJZ64_06725 [Ruminococcus sp.]|nr:hypothetical protein [Ruminococcus sp.]
MSKKIRWMYIILTAMVISVIIIVGSASYTVRHKKAIIKEQDEVTSMPQYGYTLKEYEGYLALFRGESETPYQRLDMPVNMLSEYDRKLMEEGISVETEAELRVLLEDFTG